jgi:hypothetical protein
MPLQATRPPDGRTLVDTRRASGFATSSLTTRQQKELNAVRTFLGEAASVRAYATGRANARWSDGARFLAAACVAVPLVLLVVFHVVLIPGVLVFYILYSMVRPRRGIAATATGVTELALSMWNGRPSSVLATTGHGSLLESGVVSEGDKMLVRFGAEVVSLRNADLALLRSGAAIAAQPVTAQVPGALPPPPGVYVFGADATEAGKPLPRWRESTILWALAHFLLGSTLFLGVSLGAFLVADLLGRDTTNPSPDGAALWLSYLVTVAAWLCFVFYRGSRRTRLFLLAGLLGGALAIASVAVVLGSPLVQH